MRQYHSLSVMVVVVALLCGGQETATAWELRAGLETTVVFVYKETIPDQDLFIRGGIGEEQRPEGCSPDVETDPCAIDISTNLLGTILHYEKYNAWRVGDTRLDWSGGQPGQGVYQGMSAEGTPLVWTTDNVLSPGYQELNVYGEHYWMVSMDMNCTQTEEGWFELKGYLTNTESNWESDVTQSTCTGTVGGSAPYSSVNHLGRCGYINVFTFDAPDCIIDAFPDTPH